MDTSRLEALKELLQSEPNDSDLHYMLANEYLKLEKFPEAIQHLQTYLSLAEDEGAAYRMLAQAHLQLGHVEAARHAYEEGIRASLKHHHPGMAMEFEEALKALESS